MVLKQLPSGVNDIQLYQDFVSSLIESSWFVKIWQNLYKGLSLRHICSPEIGNNERIKQGGTTPHVGGEMVVKHLLPKLTFWCLFRSSRYVMVLLLLVVQSEKVSDENTIRSLELPFRSGPLRFFSVQHLCLVCVAFGILQLEYFVNHW